MYDTGAMQKLALQIRIGAMEQFRALGVGHLGGTLSICDLLAVLYGGVMKIRPKEPDWQGRDRLVCSKGHAGPAIYAALGLKGFFPYEEIKTLNQPGTKFPSHCDRQKTPGVDMTTGSLGQGASLATGMAFGDRIKNRPNRTFLILGDGELNEGQVWEGAMFAASKKLDNMFWFVDNNKKQLDGYLCDIIEPFDICEKFRAFGFDAVNVPGNDVQSVLDGITKAQTVSGKPHMIVLDTIKGAGVPDVENTMANHSMAVTRENTQKWLDDLHEELAALERGMAK